MINQNLDMQDETYSHANMQKEFNLPHSPHSDSNFDYRELFKKPVQAKLLNYTAIQHPPASNNEINLSVLLSDSPRHRPRDRMQMHVPPLMYIESQPTAPEQTHPPPVSFNASPAAPPDRIHLRSPKANKPPKFELYEDSEPSSSSSCSQGSFIPCHCTKTHCLKLYCSCFHNNRLCGPTCECSDCLNDQTHPEQRKDAVDFVRNKGVKAHEIDKFDTTQVWGCNCKKTHCVKRYCECFTRNKKCSSHCKCDSCENRRAPPLKKKIKHPTTKK